MNKDRVRTIGKYMSAEASHKRFQNLKGKTYREIYEELKNEHPIVQMSQTVSILLGCVDKDKLKEVTQRQSEIISGTLQEYAGDLITFKKLKMIGELKLEEYAELMDWANSWDRIPYNGDTNIVGIDCTDGELIEDFSSKPLQTTEDFYREAGIS